MSNQSLNNIMNQMARQENVVSPSGVARSAMEPLGELEAFAVLDDVLASLRKDYLNAKTHRKELVKMFGADDAMVSVAMDMEDSAWCAMQVRYVELRAKRDMMQRAQAMMNLRARQIEEANERIEQSNKKKEAQNFAAYLKLIALVKEKNKTPQIFEWMILFLIFRIDLTGRPLNKKFDNFAMAA